ncbi:MAG: hypothetical protein Q4E01_03740 [Actinomycetaceae bacterium]|nr:hypothetical protein [Actinomycetaceae bacterium]
MESVHGVSLFLHYEGVSKALPRARRSNVFKDPRFILGISLIVLSILATTWLVQRASAGEDVYQLKVPIAEGQPITADSLVIVSARTGSDAYLEVGALPEGALASRTLGAGELLPREAVTTEALQDRRQVVINVATRIPSSVAIGSQVEVWATDAPQVLQKDKSEPELIASSAVILKISEPDTTLVNRAQSVEISVTEADLARVLAATGSASTLVVVPAG